MSTVNPISFPNLLAGYPLTKRGDGYVYWRGVEVEHYSFREDVEAEQAAARKLVANCLALEALGLPVNARTAISPDCYNAVAGSPWLFALPRYYAFFNMPSGRTTGIFYRHAQVGHPPTVFSIEAVEGVAQVEEHEDAYTAFHALQNRGGTCLPAQPTFEQVVSRLELLGVSVARLEQELAPREH